ncbi:NADPH-dependent FMN reductase [Alteribacillus bidgolensis]|uniref:FMN reductase/FAD reductase [NAD(P)H] n=1 Tax=Alteribacillus bidgolensis TaxID=930129 RepID=A0A1G8REY2_9BACI|nr:NAD(P)H-dependent oxidoreductase [Alteribacillus bidgolensis]SDJ15567.1 FMN reductase/FAD reductase [NAD(P)H] [Alteribacillus bidgolensis]
MKLLGISGTVVGSKPKVVVQKVLDQVKQNHPEIEVELLDLKDYNIQFCDGRDPSTYTGDTKEVIDIVSSADFYIIGTPIFQGSITGALKNLFDLVHPKSLRNKVMGFIATGGTYQHYLVIENQLKPISSYFRAFVAPGFVYAHNDHFSPQNELVDMELLERVNSLSEEIVFMQKTLKENKSYYEYS